MPTPSTRLGLLVPSRSDDFVTGDIAANWETLDNYPGVYICTSTTRPTWGAAQAGMQIRETDTGLGWAWSGTFWYRTNPKGLIQRKQVTSDMTVASTGSYAVTSLKTDVLTWASGNRTALITLTWNNAFNNTAGYFFAAVCRGIVAGSGFVQTWQIAGDNDGSGGSGTKGQGIGLICYEPSLGPGTYQWSFQIRTPGGGTATIKATPTSPIELTVIEI